MKIKLFVIVAALLTAAGATALVLLNRAPVHPRRPPPQPGQAAPSHGAGIDSAMASVNAMLNVPEGKTPCDTAWAAVQAELTTAKATGHRSIFLKVAERDDFLSRCNAFPKDAQACLVPKYATQHHDECQKLRPSEEARKGLFEVRPERHMQD